MTSPSGRWTSPPGGGHGPCPARSAAATSSTRSRSRGPRPAWTSGPANGCPVLPALAAAVDRGPEGRRRPAGRRRAAAPGELFTAGGQTLRRARLTRPSRRIWAEDPGSGKRRDLTREEDNAFWAWAAIEVLRHTGIRIEELTELSHHSLVQYRLPPSGELIPLLQIAPSKTDEERLLVIAPELADVLAAIITGSAAATAPSRSVIAYDSHEYTWNPPMPLLFQRLVGLENRPVARRRHPRPASAARSPRPGSPAPAGKPLDFQPHDFRRIFTTDAILNGMPPHIAQLILGHSDINTTMGYKAVYPEEAINGHRAFIARRRELRPSEEYRSPTDEEWDEFLGHFERRQARPRRLRPGLRHQLHP